MSPHSSDQAKIDFLEASVLEMRVRIGLLESALGSSIRCPDASTILPMTDDDLGGDDPLLTLDSSHDGGSDDSPQDLDMTADLAAFLSNAEYRGGPLASEAVVPDRVQTDFPLNYSTVSNNPDQPLYGSGGTAPSTNPNPSTWTPSQDAPHADGAGSFDAIYYVPVTLRTVPGPIFPASLAESPHPGQPLRPLAPSTFHAQPISANVSSLGGDVLMGSQAPAQEPSQTPSSSFAG
jgi:hypothetical protein